MSWQQRTAIDLLRQGPCTMLSCLYFLVILGQAKIMSKLYSPTFCVVEHLKRLRGLFIDRMMKKAFENKSGLGRIGPLELLASMCLCPPREPLSSLQPRIAALCQAILASR